MKSKTEKSRPYAICASFILSIFVLSFAATPANAADKVKWARIVGIVEPDSTVGGIVDGTAAPWTVTSGAAEVDLDTGSVKFKVRGLVIAGDPTFANIGTTTVITMVKGTLVCNETDDPELVDTEAVPLSALGSAKFNGSVELPESCTDEPEDIVFLIRIAGVVSGFEFLLDRWNAFGAVRVLPPSNPPRTGFIWGHVVNESGSCIVDAVVEIVAGPNTGQKVVQKEPCSVWGYGDGFYFNDLPLGVTIRLRATKEGYRPKELETMAVTSGTALTVVLRKK